MTPIKFGIILSLIGISYVFIALVAILTIFELLKRFFKIRELSYEFNKSVTEVEMGVEEHVAIAISIITYMQTTFNKESNVINRRKNNEKEI